MTGCGKVRQRYAIEFVRPRLSFSLVYSSRVNKKLNQSFHCNLTLRYNGSLHTHSVLDEYTRRRLHSATCTIFGTRRLFSATCTILGTRFSKRSRQLSDQVRLSLHKHRMKLHYGILEQRLYHPTDRSSHQSKSSDSMVARTWSYFTRRKISPPAHSRLPHCTRSTLRHCFTLGKRRARPFFLLSRVCKRAAPPFGGQQSQKRRQATLNYIERNSFVDVNAKRTRVKLTRQIKNCVARYNELATTEWKFDEQTETSEWENTTFPSGVCRRSTRRSYEKR